VLKCLYGVVDGVRNVWCVLGDWIWLVSMRQWRELIFSPKRTGLA